MTASVELLFAPAAPGNPFHVAKMRLIASLARLPVPTIDIDVQCEQIEAVGDFIADIAHHTDVLMRAVGAELKANAPYRFDTKNFESPCFDGLDGFALFDVQTLVDAWRCEAEEAS